MPSTTVGLIEVEGEVCGGISVCETRLGAFERTLHPEMMQIIEERKMILLTKVGEVRLNFTV